MKRQSVMHEAAARGDTVEILALLQAGANIEERNRYGETPLMAAACRDHKACCQVLLEHGAELHSVSTDGKTALHQAALYGKLETVKLLVNRGADVNVHDTFGDYTPLHLAAAHANRQIVIEMCDILLSAGADVNARTKWDTTPLWSAATAGRIELLEFLLSRGSELDARDKEGRTPLIFIVKHPFHPDMLSFLLARGSDVSAQDVNGRTALMYAAEAANEKSINILLDNAADLTLQDKSGRTALMYAAGEAPKMSEIGMLGCEISTMKEGGNAPQWNSEKKALRLAKAYHFRAEAIRLLRRRGASPDVQDALGRTALDIALENAQAVGKDNAEVVVALMQSDGL